MPLAATLARTVAPFVDSARAAIRRRGGLAAPTSRARFLAPLAGQTVLEIGPFDNPVVSGPGVSYFDVLDSAALRERAARLGRSFANVPAIDYSSPTGDLSIVDRTFDAVVSSHAIEHQPDLVRHLNDVAALLRPGGRYHVIAPDKRYCFDHFLPLSSLDEVIAAHAERRRVHTRAAVTAHRLDTTHNSPIRHWLGAHGARPERTAELLATTEADGAAADAGAYVDVHAWIFSPQRFRETITELRQRDLIQLDLVEVHDTAFGDLEYFAVLERPAG